MKSQQKYWDQIFKEQNLKTPIYDEWLNKYLPLLLSANTIVDLGCGNGPDTLFLYKQNIHPIACDFSEEAIKKINELCPEIRTLCFDMSKGLPFMDHSVDIVIADLSLHYFNWRTTEKIISDICRVLVKGGLLLGRVNSIKDINFGATEGIVLETNYYYNNGCKKRFFDIEDLYKLFNNWNITSIEESSSNKYGQTKILWEFCIKSTDSYSI